MISKYNRIKKMIEEMLRTRGTKRVIIYPFGELGLLVKSILNYSYNVFEDAIVDNELCMVNREIYSCDFFSGISPNEYVVLLSTDNRHIRDEIRRELLTIFKRESIFELEEKIPWYERASEGTKTTIGKYSAGPLCCDHPLIESIGSFCSFAEGCCVHGNHAMQYISTHPMLYKASHYDINQTMNYEDYSDADWYFAGVAPKGEVYGERRIKIGNDVWLGRNVVIVNYSNIGNGVIAGAGSIITHDVPDYAVVVGAPARIIRYRYDEQEIQQLNKIAWWDWSDEQIRERFDDFYLSAGDFIRKYATT